MNARDLERITDSRTMQERAEKYVEEMPPEKIEEALCSCVIKHAVCDECGAESWFIAMAGYNDNSECHECGTTYAVIG